MMSDELMSDEWWLMKCAECSVGWLSEATRTNSNPQSTGPIIMHAEIGGIFQIILSWSRNKGAAVQKLQKLWFKMLQSNGPMYDTPRR